MNEGVDSSDSSYGFSKAKLSQGSSYPLKRSLLDMALREKGVHRAVCSVYYLRPVDSSVLHARFVPVGAPAHHTVVGRSFITLWAVPSEIRLALEERIRAYALPRLCDWLARSQDEGSAWRLMRHDLFFQLSDGELVYHES